MTWLSTIFISLLSIPESRGGPGFFNVAARFSFSPGAEGRGAAEGRPSPLLRHEHGEGGRDQQGALGASETRRDAAKRKINERLHPSKWRKRVQLIYGNKQLCHWPTKRPAGATASAGVATTLGTFGSALAGQDTRESPCARDTPAPPHWSPLPFSSKHAKMLALISFGCRRGATKRPAGATANADAATTLRSFAAALDGQDTRDSP